MLQDNRHPVVSTNIRMLVYTKRGLYEQQKDYHLREP